MSVIAAVPEAAHIALVGEELPHGVAEPLATVRGATTDLHRALVAFQQAVFGLPLEAAAQFPELFTTVVRAQQAAVELLEAAYNVDQTATALAGSVPVAPPAVLDMVTATKLAADQALERNDLTSAISSYERVLSLAPDADDAKNNLSVALLGTQQYRRAQVVLHERLTQRRGLAEPFRARYEPTRPVAEGFPSYIASPGRLRDTAAQLRYLIETAALDPSFAALADQYEALSTTLAERTDRLPYSPLPTDLLQALNGYQDRVVFYGDGAELGEPAVNPDVNWRAIDEEYRETRCVSFDDLLTPPALRRLREFLLASTIYFNYSEAGFVGSYVTDGLDCPLIFQIVRELHAALPRLLATRPLNNMWAYRYQPQGAGVRPHNGDGSVTINFWLSDDAANLTPGRGGMVMYDKEHPPEWDWTHTNMYKDDGDIQSKIAQYLSDAREQVVPYRCNRAVLFHSTLFHKTDPFRFQPSYASSRMNITMLFGKRGQESAALR